MDKIITRYNKKPIQSNIYVLQGLKLSLNDLLVEYLKHERGFKQKQLFTDMRIVVGLFSVACAIITCYISMYKDFSDYKNELVVLLGIYFSLNFLLEIWTMLFFRNVIFEGTNKDGSVRIDGFNRAVDTNYKLIIYRNGKVVPGTFSKSVYELYDESGVLDHETFLKEIAPIFV